MKQGDHQCAVCDGPTKRPQYMRISRLITVTYLPSIEMYWTVEQAVLFRLFRYFSTVWNFDFPEVTASNVTFSTCLRWQVTQDIRRRRWHHSQFPLTITPQCVMYVCGVCVRECMCVMYGWVMCVCMCVWGVKPPAERRRPRDARGTPEEHRACHTKATGRAAETKGRGTPSPWQCTLPQHIVPRLPHKSHRQSGGDQGTPEGRQRDARGTPGRTAEPLAVHIAPRLPRKSHRQSGGDQGTPEGRQRGLAVHLCECVCVRVYVYVCVCEPSEQM